MESNQADHQLLPPVPQTADVAQRLQYHVHKLETVLSLERKLRHSKEEQTQYLRQRLRRMMQVVKTARAREQHILQNLEQSQQALRNQHAAVLDPDATIISHTLAYPSYPSLPSASATFGPSLSLGSAHHPATNSTARRGAGPGSLPAQFRLHEYRIDSVLGQGGFGITYLATDVNLNAKVAIKEYLPTAFAYRDLQYSIHAKTSDERTLYQTGLDNFLLEARTLATFRHPNIVRVARFFEAHNSAYIVLEYEQGQPLRSWWKPKKPAPEAELLALLQPLLDGLALVHENGYLHRDIKPDNIYVRRGDGSLVLLDFGAAQHSSARSHELSAIVTPGYAPLEQYDDGVQGPWTDIYAFAATLYWMVTGGRPPAAPERAAGAAMPTAVEAGQGRYSLEMLAAIDRGLQLDASQRPQSIAEFSQELYAAHGASLGLQAALQLDEGRNAGMMTMRQSWRILLNSPKLLFRRMQEISRALMQPGSWPMALKMTLALTMAALLPMLITAYYNLNGSVQAVSSAELRNLEQLAQSLAGRVGQLVVDSGNLANYLATDDVFIEYLRQPNKAGEAQIYEKIKHLHQTNPDVHRLLLIDQKGLVLISSDPAVIGKNSKNRDYFRSAMAGKPFVTSMLVSLTDGSPGIFYSNPVYNKERQVIGAVVLRIKGSTVDHLLFESTKGSGRIPFLIDGDGVIISYPDNRQVFHSLAPLPKQKQEAMLFEKRFGIKPVTSLGMPELGKAMLASNKAGNINYFSTISNEVEHAGFAPVRGHNWVVAVTEPRSQFEAPLQRLFGHVMYSVALVGLVFFLLAMWFARSIVRPILRLTEAANALKEGDYDKANIRVNSNDEIGKLARTFNVMIDVLRQRERERRRGRQASDADQS